MDTTKWKSVAIRVDVYGKYSKFCNKKKWSKSDGLEILMAQYTAAKKAEAKEIAELKAANNGKVA